MLNVSSGISFTVVDEGGCSVPIVEQNILVIGPSKVFTPNADGYNDRWNIYMSYKMMLVLKFTYLTDIW
jgi:hypothetical protein